MTAGREDGELIAEVSREGITLSIYRANRKLSGKRLLVLMYKDSVNNESRGIFAHDTRSDVVAFFGSGVLADRIIATYDHWKSVFP